MSSSTEKEAEAVIKGFVALVLLAIIGIIAFFQHAEEFKPGNESVSVRLRVGEIYTLRAACQSGDPDLREVKLLDVFYVRKQGDHVLLMLGDQTVHETVGVITHPSLKSVFCGGGEEREYAVIWEASDLEDTAHLRIRPGFRLEPKKVGLSYYFRAALTPGTNEYAVLASGPVPFVGLALTVALIGWCLVDQKIRWRKGYIFFGVAFFAVILLGWIF